ncbi:MAG: tetratricopeptide (TPR) repeat protein [Bradymonadia bacterium]|jgi:tetratricopeptide (TPR) repeat protein/ABC-type uncharacterized transport system YnjBCD ATPase subunit
MSSDSEVKFARVCPECGHVNETPTDYCLYCGAPLGFRATDDSMARAASSRESWRIFGVDSPFVGRAETVEQILAVIDTAVNEQSGALITITGPEGCGRTRLLDAVNSELVERYPDALMPKAYVREGQLQPYSAITQLLNDRFYLPRLADPAEHGSRLSDGIGALVGGERGVEVAGRLSQMLGLSETPNDSREEVESGWRRALTALLRADASRQPLVLAIDDIDHAGAETISLLAEVLPQVADTPFVLIATANEATEGFSASALAGDLSEEAIHSVSMTRLADADVSELVRAILSRVENLPDTIVQRLTMVAVGNPLVVEEGIRILIQSGVIDTRGNFWTADLSKFDETELPGEVEEVVRARLEHLSEPERLRLRDAAIIGDTFWLGAVVALHRQRRTSPDDTAALDGRDDQSQIVAELEALVRRDILREHPGSSLRGEREFSFKHWVERRMHRSDLREDETTRMHLRVAQWLQVRSAADPERFLVAIAGHLASGGLVDRASDFYARAGRLCQHRYANDRAVTHLESALELLDAADELNRADLLDDLGSLYALSGRHDDAVAAFTELAQIAWQVSSGRRLAIAFEKLGQVRRAVGDYDSALDLFHRARGRFESLEDRAGVASTLDNTGQIHWIRGQYDYAEHAYKGALEIRRELGNRRALARSLSSIGTLLVYRGQFQNALARFRESLEIRREENDLQGIAESLNTIGVIFEERGDSASAARIWSEAVGVARDSGDRGLEAMLLNNLGEAELSQGHLEAAEARLGEASSIAESMNDRRVLFDSIRNLGVLQSRKGNQRLALDHADEALELARSLRSRAMEGIALRTIGELHGQTMFDDSGEEGGKLAEEAFRRAIDLFKALEDERELGRTFHSFGTYLIEQRLLVQGKQHLELAREIFQRLEMRRILAQTEATIHDL